MVKVAVYGASGYVGGELLRILLSHSSVEITAATSKRFSGMPVHKVHPNLRKVCQMSFVEPKVENVVNAEVVFTALPHGQSTHVVKTLLDRGLKVIDLGADFRLKDPSAYEKWYGFKHPYPELLEKAVYGLPELHRDEIRTASLIAVPGCMASASILALVPPVKNGLVDRSQIFIDAKIGSSGAGSSPTLEGYHPERYNVVRPYKPAGHRHVAEIVQEVSNAAGGGIVIGFSPHSVNIVRGILVTVHARPSGRLPSFQDLWRCYRQAYDKEPFIRLVRDPTMVHGLPDPKYLIGSNFADIGFEIDADSNRVILFAAIDNLVKGAAGNAVQCFNIIFGFDEKEGLTFPGLHPA
ncbi:MAG: N-acetyl-gamma-glutamyl-phosphate reductase [Candidatus Brockarchaeota archaeon]|nr:N-acetyl-gamma-glutamyl-phosphate reductase [Candidatus Brockarchaeota archaeon]